MNNFTVEIDGKYYTSHAVFPFKFANLLDEQLDEAYITLKRIDKEYFLPLTPVTITVTSFPGARYLSGADVSSGKDGNGSIVSRDVSTSRVRCTMTFNMVVANDKAIEIISAKKNGVKRYDHELYLIEQTKILEGYIGDSITFTNPLGNNFIDT